MQLNHNEILDHFIAVPPRERAYRIQRWLESICQQTADYHEWEALLLGLIAATVNHSSLNNATKGSLLIELINQIQSPLCAYCKDEFVPVLRDIFANCSLGVRTVLWDKYKTDLGPYEMLGDFWASGKLFDETEEIYPICGFFEDETKRGSLETVLEEINKLKIRIPETASSQLERIEKKVCLYSLKNTVIGQQLRAKVYKSLRRVIHDDSSILIIGLSGIGKKGIVKYIHRTNGFSGDPLVVNCATLTMRKLAGTKSSEGLLEQAKNRVLCLDEVHELKSQAQKDLKTILAEKQVAKSNGTLVKLDFKLVATSSKLNIVENWQDVFKEVDIWARLSDHVFIIPPLSERRQDLETGLRRLVTPLNIAPDVMDDWKNRDYEGNWRDIKPATREICSSMCDLNFGSTITKQTLEELKPHLSEQTLKVFALA